MTDQPSQPDPYPDDRLRWFHDPGPPRIKVGDLVTLIAGDVSRVYEVTRRFSRGDDTGLVSFTLKPHQESTP